MDFKKIKFPYLFSGLLLVFLALFFLGHLVLRQVRAQEIAELQKFSAVTAKNQLFKGLKEYSSLPIDLNKVEVGRDNPFTPFE